MENAIKTQRLSKIMTRICELAIIILPLSIIWFWLNIGQNLSELSIAKTTVLLDMQYIQNYQVFLGFTLSILTTLPLLYGLWHLRLLFQLFQKHVFFSDDATRHLYIFSMMLFISSLLVPIRSALMSLLLTSGNPIGKKMLVVEFGNNEFALIFIAATLLAITWVLKEGQRLAAENKEFI